MEKEIKKASEPIEDEEEEYYYFDPEAEKNMPCDTYGMLACTPDCPKYWECHPTTLK